MYFYRTVDAECLRTILARYRLVAVIGKFNVQNLTPDPCIIFFNE